MKSLRPLLLFIPLTLLVACGGGKTDNSNTKQVADTVSQDLPVEKPQEVDDEIATTPTNPYEFVGEVLMDSIDTITTPPGGIVMDYTLGVVVMVPAGYTLEETWSPIQGVSNEARLSTIKSSAPGHDVDRLETFDFAWLNANCVNDANSDGKVTHATDQMPGELDLDSEFVFVLIDQNNAEVGRKPYKLKRAKERDKKLNSDN